MMRVIQLRDGSDLDCCNVSGVLMSASATPKSVLIGKHRQHEADLLSQGRL